MSGIENKIRQWLRAERREHRRRAERHLGRALRGLPDLAPAPGFTARVLAACGIAEPSRSPALRWLRRTGWAIEVLALLAVGIVTLLLPALGRVLPVGLAPALAAAVGERLLLIVGQLLVTGARLWTGFVELGDLAGQALRTPAGAGSVAALLACGFMLLWSLDRLVAAQEMTTGSFFGRNSQ